MDGADLADLGTAQAAVSDLLRLLGRDDWDRPTPCEAWDVAAVVRHLVVGERAFAVSLGGKTYDLPAIDAEVAGVADRALAAAYADAGRGLYDAMAAAGDGPFPTGLGPLPAPAVARLRTIEALPGRRRARPGPQPRPHADAATGPYAVRPRAAGRCRRAGDRSAGGLAGAGLGWAAGWPCRS